MNLSGTNMIFIIVITLQSLYLVYRVIKNDEDNVESEYNIRKNFNRFDIEEDMYSLNYLISIITNEYVDTNILNGNKDKTGQKRINIPSTNKEHQENVDDITNLVMNLISDEHILYLEKYIDVSKLKYITRIYVKGLYFKLIQVVTEKRVNELDNHYNEIQKNNENDNNVVIPKDIQEILDYYGMSLSQAKEEVRNTQIDTKKVRSINGSDSDTSKYIEDIQILKGFFNNK